MTFINYDNYQSYNHNNGIQEPKLLGVINIDTKLTKIFTFKKTNYLFILHLCIWHIYKLL